MFGRTLAIAITALIVLSVVFTVMGMVLDFAFYYIALATGVAAFVSCCSTLKYK